MPPVKIRWLGHSGFSVQDPSGKTVLVDPWFQGNPTAPGGPEEVRKAEVEKALSVLGTDDPKTRKVVEALSASMLNKMLHAPIAAMKRESDGRSPMKMVAAIREIFGLQEQEPEKVGETGKRPEPEP